MQGAPITEEILDATPSLKLICVARGGPVNVDIAAASERGIPVVTTPGKNAQAVAELTIGFMVMLARRMPEIMRHAEGGGEVSRDNYEGSKWFGHDLEGHTLGLVGYGQIGHKVALIATAMGMSVVRPRPVRGRREDRGPGGRARGPGHVARAVGLRVAPRPDDRGEPGHDRARADRQDEEGHVPHQHRA